MRVIVSTCVEPRQVLRFDVQPRTRPGRLLHRYLPRDVFVVHPETYSRLVDRLGPLEESGIPVDDLTAGERTEALSSFDLLHSRLETGDLVPGRD